MADERGEPEQQVLPDARLLFVLVAVLVLGAVAAVARYGGGDDASLRTVQLGRLEGVMAAMDNEPLVIADLPGIVITRGPIDPANVDPRWGEATGMLPLDRRNALFALSLEDPADGATLEWCTSSERFEHPEGRRTYAVDGELMTGDGPRGMDRRSLSIGAAGNVTIDPGRWVAGLPVDRTAGDVRPRGPSGNG